MRLCFLALYFFCSAVFATSCYISEEQSAENSIKHQNKVDIEITLVDSDYSVMISLPAQIDNLSFQGVFLVADDLENPTFFTQLQPFEENGKNVAWYTINAGLIRRHFIVASFGECGIDVFKEVLYHEI